MYDIAITKEVHHGGDRMKEDARDEESFLAPDEKDRCEARERWFEKAKNSFPSSYKRTAYRKVEGSTTFVQPQRVSPCVIAAHCALIILYSTIFVILRLQRNSSSLAQDGFYTPVQAAVIPEVRTISVKINETFNPYNGAPSPEVDAAWADLFKYANVRITKEEMEQLGRPSIELADEVGGYFGTLDVYHQLHCLKYIRQYVHQDYYKLGHTNVPNTEHVNHCIDMLRQVIMCKADTAMMTYRWLPEFPGPWPNFGIEHQCVNWDKINNWSRERSFDIFDPKNLQHPTFGFPYAHLVGLPSPKSDHDDQ